MSEEHIEYSEHEKRTVSAGEHKALSEHSESNKHAGVTVSTVCLHRVQVSVVSTVAIQPSSEIAAIISSSYVCRMYTHTTVDAAYSASL